MSTVQTILDAVASRIWREGETFSANTEPDLTMCYQWLNEDARTIAGICAQEGSELGRTLSTITTAIPEISAITAASPGNVTTSTVHGLSSNDEVLIKSVVGMTEVNDRIFTATVIDTTNFTIGIDTSAYTAWTSGGIVYKLNYSDINDLISVGRFGWIQNTYSRDKLELTTRMDELDYNPSSVSEPSKFYIDENIDIRFLDTADAAYTIRIPYWPTPTALSAVTDTMPFKEVFDNLFIESLSIRILNRAEYDLSHELNWYNFMINEARKIIRMRMNPTSSVGI